MKIHDLKLVTLNKKNFMAPFYGWSSTTRNTWYSFDWPQKDERLSPPGVTQWFWTQDLGLGIQCFNHSANAVKWYTKIYYRLVLWKQFYMLNCQSIKILSFGACFSLTKTKVICRNWVFVSMCRNQNSRQISDIVR